MAEGEQVKWPEVTIQKDMTAEGGWYFVQPGDKPRARPHVASETYRPASHFTQLVEGLEAEIDRLRRRPDAALLQKHEADRLEALLDQHKKEGR